MCVYSMCVTVHNCRMYTTQHRTDMIYVNLPTNVMYELRCCLLERRVQSDVQYFCWWYLHADLGISSHFVVLCSQGRSHEILFVGGRDGVQTYAPQIVSVVAVVGLDPLSSPRVSYAPDYSEPK